MRDYKTAADRYGVKHTGRQERKWNRGTGMARILEARFGGEESAPTSDEVKVFIDSRSKPGPNPNKKVKESGQNRTSRKDQRNSRRRDEAQRQKTHKKDKWRRRTGKKVA